MNFEKFTANPWHRVPVMVIITAFFAFFGVELVKFIITAFGPWHPFNGRLWIIPVCIGAYVWWSATIVSFVMIFFKRPLKFYREEGLIAALIETFIAAFIAALIAAIFIEGLNETFIAALIAVILIAGIILRLIAGLIAEFGKNPEGEASKEFSLSEAG